jgi:hypothetical protein
MKVLVLCDAGGDIQSVAVPGPDQPGQLHLEVEGGPAAREIEVDESVIRPDELLGRQGPEAAAKALQQLRKLL